ncbi:MAG: sulfatase-like hydrolase/transferase [Bacteroidota bacterium]
MFNLKRILGNVKQKHTPFSMKASATIYCLSFLLLISCQELPELSNSQPNIILVLADDMSYYDLSCLGQKEFKTPNLDKLCHEGLFFSEAYSGSPECAPSRSTIMEGLHLGHNRIRVNNSVRGQDHLLDTDITVAERLKDAGYATGFVGKWGIGLPGTEGVPDKQGFDYTFGYYDQGRAHTYYPHFLYENGKKISIPGNYGFDMDQCYAHTKSKEGLNVYNEKGELIPNGIKESDEARNSQDLIHEKALQFIKGNSNKPLFLYYATQLPHGPCITPDLGEYKDKPWDMKHKEWAAMMTHLDRHVGELIDLTVELDIHRNTIILFASDNGYSHYGYFGRDRWEDDPVFKNKGPWRGGKFGSFDGGMRVPMMAYWPERVPHGTTNHQVVLYDIMETACDLAGVEPPKNDGISFVPLLEGKPEKHKEHAFLYWGGGTYMPQAQAVRLGNWFGMRENSQEPVQLWDLENDLGCEHDVASGNPEIVAEILQIMKNEHIDSEWFQNPGESGDEIEAKREKAIELECMQKGTRANSTYPGETNFPGGGLSRTSIDASTYHSMRGGISNSFIKFEREKRGRVAFLGGSITYNGGWRDSICSYLTKRFPETEFDFIAAGIPSMGTTPAAFRLQRDVLKNGVVDLLFEEAAVNDAGNGRTSVEQQRAMEGIVRHLRSSNPACDIVLMHFADPDKIESYGKGQIPLVIQNHEKVAAHYNIPTINLAKEVTNRIDAGEFTWKDDFKDLHPSPFGQNIYYQSMRVFLEKAWLGIDSEEDLFEIDQMPKALDPACYENGVLKYIEDVALPEGWKYVESWHPKDGKNTRPNYTEVPMLIGEEPGKVLKFTFEGNAVGIAVAAGPDAGIIEFSIDGGLWQKRDLFTRWSSSLHLPWYYTLASGLNPGEHLLQIKVSKQKNPESVGNSCRIRYFFVNKAILH